MRREAIVLAGGFGTRLRKEAPDVPKPMAPVSNRPFMRYILDRLVESDFEKIVIADGYKKEVIEDYFGNTYRGVEICYSSEIEPLLTGGAVKKAMSCCDAPYVYVFNGDTYFDVDFGRMENVLCCADHGLKGVVSCLTLDDCGRYGRVMFDQCTGRIFRFEEKCSEGTGVINGGVYLFERDAFSSLPNVFSLEEGFLGPAAEQGLLFASVCDGAFIDIGIPEDYRRAQELFSWQSYRLAIFDRDGTINVDTGHLFEEDKLELIDGIASLVKMYNDDPRFKVVVATNQAGIAKGMYGVSEMKRLHRVLNERLGLEGAHVDAYYYCPHHPDFTGECDCRKPKSGMLDKAIFDFDAHPDECVMYGDKWTDAEAAAKAGIEFVWIQDKLGVFRKEGVI